MKGVVVDKKGKYAVLLTGDGSFIKIKNQVDYKVGYEVEFKKRSFADTRLLRKISAVAAVSLFTLGLSYGAYSYALPYSYVDIDINPSIELTANVFDVIIKTETFNEDGKQLLEKNDLKFKTLDAGVSELMDSAIEHGYLKEDADNTVLLTIASKNGDKSEKLKESLESSTEKTLNKGNIKSSVLLQESTTQKHDDAKASDISPGKMSLIEKAMEDEPQLKLDELKDASLKDIVKHIPEYNRTETAKAGENGKTRNNAKVQDSKTQAWTPKTGMGKAREDNGKGMKGPAGKGSENNGDDNKTAGKGNGRNYPGNNGNAKGKDSKQDEEKRGFGKTEINPRNWFNGWNFGKDRPDTDKGNNNNRDDNRNRQNNRR